MPIESSNYYETLYIIINVRGEFMDRKELVFRLGTVRREANLSARELSLRLDKNDGYINRMESANGFMPSMELFFKILQECNYTPEKFFYHDPKSYDKDMAILEKFKNLTDDKKEALLLLLKDFK